MAREIHGSPTNNDRDVDGKAGGEYKEGNVFEGAVGVNGEENGATNDGDSEAKENEEEAVGRAV